MHFRPGLELTVVPWHRTRARVHGPLSGTSLRAASATSMLSKRASPYPQVTPSAPPSSPSFTVTSLRLNSISPVRSRPHSTGRSAAVYLRSDRMSSCATPYGQALVWSLRRLHPPCGSGARDLLGRRVGSAFQGVIKSGLEHVLEPSPPADAARLAQVRSQDARVGVARPL